MLIRIAWRNLGRGWRRSALVLSSVALGLAATVVMLAWVQGLSRQMIETPVRIALGHIAIHAQGYYKDPDVATNLDVHEDRLLELGSSANEGRASARLRAEGLVQTARKTVRANVIGVEPANEARVSSVPGSLVEGSFLEQPATGRGLPGVVIGAEMAEQLKVQLGDKVVLRVAGEAGLGAFRVAGIFNTGSVGFDRTGVYIRLDRARTLTGVAGATEISLFLTQPKRLPQVLESLRGAVEADFGPGVFEVLSWAERETRLAYMIELAGQMSWTLYVIVYVATAFGIANAVLMSVFERIREFGLLRSMGLRGSRVVVMVLLEALFLTGLGSLIGVSIAFGVASWLGCVGIDLSAWSEGMAAMGTGSEIYPRVSVSELWTPIWLGVVTALLSGLWPAQKAARIRPAEAMRAT